ncbi:MAG: hypothetical protein QXQ02_03195 [Halobacteria archaeon]
MKMSPDDIAIRPRVLARWLIIATDIADELKNTNLPSENVGDEEFYIEDGLLVIRCTIKDIHLEERTHSCTDYALTIENIGHDTVVNLTITDSSLWKLKNTN